VRASDVMSTSVVTTTPDMTVETVAQLMINHRISGVPVVDKNGRLAGIVTEGDLLRRAETGTERRRSHWSEWLSSGPRLAAEYIKSHARRVEDIMTREVVTVGELATLAEIADLMETKRIKRVPVAHDGKIIGIVSRADLLRVLASGGAKPADEDTDGMIRSRLLFASRNGRAYANRTLSSRTASSISGASSDRRRNAGHCMSSRKTSPASAASRTT
jgi:CBS domain-containing protein